MFGDLLSFKKKYSIEIEIVVLFDFFLQKWKEGEDARVRKLRRFKVLLPNEMVVPNEENKLPFGDFIGLVRNKYLKVRMRCE